MEWKWGHILGDASRNVVPTSVENSYLFPTLLENYDSSFIWSVKHFHISEIKISLLIVLIWVELSSLYLGESHAKCTASPLAGFSRQHIQRKLQLGRRDSYRCQLDCALQGAREALYLRLFLPSPFPVVFPYLQPIASWLSLHNSIKTQWCPSSSFLNAPQLILKRSCRISGFGPTP